MKSNLNRRNFFRKTTQAGMAGCMLMLSPRLLAIENLSRMFQETPDPKKMNTYCTYNCTDECQFKQATLKNSSELKKKVYDEWKLADRFGEFNADKIFCYGCKVEKEKMGPLVKACTVRECCVEKGYDACIQCSEITTCDKDLWTNFPEFHKKVIELQKVYLEAKG